VRFGEGMPSVLIYTRAPESGHFLRQRTLVFHLPLWIATSLSLWSQAPL
jgi:hypothetical protein